MAKLTDIQLVEQILGEMNGESNRNKAAEIVKKLGKRIRQRHRDRDAEDFSQAAARIVKEATEGK